MPPVRFFYDCEFIEDGQTIELVSIAIVDEIGRAGALPRLDRFRSGAGRALGAYATCSTSCRRRRRRPGSRGATIREQVLEFLTADGARPQLWAWFGAYDHVALCQLWGTMPKLPRALPRFTRDLRQLWEEAGSPALPPEPADAHDALADARYNLVRWRISAPLHPAYAARVPPVPPSRRAESPGQLA